MGNPLSIRQQCKKHYHMTIFNIHSGSWSLLCHVRGIIFSLHNEISYIGKMESLYWNETQFSYITIIGWGISMYIWHLTHIEIPIIKKKMDLQPRGPWFNIKMSFYQYRKYHCGDKTILRSSYLHNGISYTDKTSLYWIGTLIFIKCIPTIRKIVFILRQHPVLT